MSHRRSQSEVPPPPVDATGDWEVHRVDGAGPFASRVTWRMPGGEQATWESRRARKRGVIVLGGDHATRPRVVQARSAIARRLRRINWVAAGAFTVGGTLFAIGAVVAQLGSGNALTAASIYLVGGIFFTTGGYASWLGAINGPRRVDAGGAASAGRWRWLSYEPERIDWLSTFLLLVGTLAFGVSLLDSFLQGLTTPEVNRLIWTPEITGCVLFLVSGHLAFAEVCHRPRPCLRRRDLGWSIVAINQIGSILFMISALAAFTRPETGSEINVAIANWGTLTGATCFAIGGVMQAFDRPAGPRSPVPGEDRD